MTSIVQSKRRLTGAAGSPGNAGFFEGELFVNMQDATSPELWAFGGHPATGTAPANKGWMRLNPDPNISVVSKTIAGTTDPATDGNAAAAAAGAWPWVVTAGQVPIVTHDGTAYAFTGGAGNWGTTSGGTALTAGMFTPLGASAGAPQVIDLTPQNPPTSANIGAAYTAVGTAATGSPTLASWNGKVHLLTNPAAPGTAASWTAISQAVTTEVVDWTALTGSPTTLAGAYAAWHGGAGAPDFAASISFVRFGAPEQTYVLVNPVNPGATASYAAVTQPMPSALQYRGNVDVIAAYAAPAPAWNVGDFATVQTTTTGNIHASWAAIGIPNTSDLHAGDLMIWDGSKFHVVVNEVDLGAYLPLAGGTMTDTAEIIFDTTTAQASAAGTGGGNTAAAGARTQTIIDGDGGLVDNVVIDCGVF